MVGTKGQGAAGVHAYIAALPPQTARHLKALRAAVLAAAPTGAESISYGIPCVSLDGRPFLYYAGWKRHVSLYPITAALRQAFADEIRGYKTSTGTLQFPLDEPVPAALVRRIAKARMAELRARARGGAAGRTGAAAAGGRETARKTGAGKAAAKTSAARKRQ